MSVSFSFWNEEGKAGDTCPAQLTLTSNAFDGSAPITFETLEVLFEGSIKPIFIRRNKAADKRMSRNFVFTAMALIENEASEDSNHEDNGIMALTGQDDLTLGPGEIRIFEMAIPLREPGDAAAKTLTMNLDTQSFSLRYLMRLQTSSPSSHVWYTSSGKKRTLPRSNPYSISILPRPPKIDVRLVNNKSQYYTNEVIVLDIELDNAEDADAVTRLDVQVFGSNSLQAVSVKVGNHEKECTQEEEDGPKGATIAVGTVQSGKLTQAQIKLGAADNPTEYGISIKVMYHLVTDPATPIIQDDGYRLTLINPFEANYELSPRLHKGSWPSLFDSRNLVNVQGDKQLCPSGLSQNWLLCTKYASFATEELQIKDLDIRVVQTHGSVDCKIHKRQLLPTDGKKVSPRTMESAEFDVTSQRMSLDDAPGQASMEVEFAISWRRLDDSQDTTNVTRLPAPRLFVSGSEPRVVSTVDHESRTGALELSLVVENPSHHFLTFGVTMEPSDQFGFSGPKNYSLNLLPVSRRAVQYRLIPYVRGAWLRPGLMVRDKYFQKVLRILPTEGIKMDKEGILIWVPDEPGDEQEKDEEKHGDEQQLV